MRSPTSTTECIEMLVTRSAEDTQKNAPEKLETDEEALERGGWANKMEFLLSCLGYAIGIGNVWRFPYLCYRNGGGAFLVPYLLMLGLCGIPLFFMETAIGQFASTSCVTMFRMCPLLKGAGIAIVVVNVICTMYYNVIIAYPIYYLYTCLSEKLPWVDCNNPWNTDKCFKLGSSRPDNTSTNITQDTKTPADEFFHNKILEISDGIGNPGTVVWHLLVCDIVSWVIVYLCIMNGIKSVGKVVYFTATFPFVILFALLVRGVTLPGAWEGIRFYVSPQWDQLANLKVWADAAVQIFFSLGPGWGGIVNMASYNDFKNNSKRDSILVPIINCSTSILAGFVVFSVIGFMSHETGIPVPSVATGGPGLAFITYPEALTMMPLPHLWSILFFCMLYLLGMDSLFVQIEAVISSVTDAYPRLRKYKTWVALVFCFSMFLGSISCITNGGMYILQLLDWYAASISVILICTVEVLIVAWIYGCDNFVRDIEFMIEDKVGIFMKLSWKYITPAILSFIFVTTIVFNTPITYNNVTFPAWAHVIGWLSACCSMVCIPLYAILRLARSNGSLYRRLTTNLRAADTWGPALEKNRSAWKVHIAKTSLR